MISGSPKSMSHRRVVIQAPDKRGNSPLRIDIDNHNFLSDSGRNMPHKKVVAHKPDQRFGSPLKNDKNNYEFSNDGIKKIPHRRVIPTTDLRHSLPLRNDIYDYDFLKDNSKKMAYRTEGVHRETREQTRNSQLKNSSKNMEHRKVVMYRKVSNLQDKLMQNSPYRNVTDDYDYLKISILNKASRVSGEFGKVTLGPGADHENGSACDSGSNEIKQPRENEGSAQKSSLNGPTDIVASLTFSVEKLELENKSQRREKVKHAVDEKWKEMRRLQKEMDEEKPRRLSLRKIEKEKETAEILARFEAEEELREKEQEINRKNEIQKRRLQESEEIQKKLNPCTENIQAKWKDIANASKTCRDKNSATRLLAQYAPQLKEFGQQMDAIFNKAKTGDLTLADVNLAEIIVQWNDEVYQSFKADIHQVEVAYAETARIVEELKFAELEAQAEAERIQQLKDEQNAIQVTHAQVEQEARQENLLHNVQSQSVVDSSTATAQPPQTNVPQSAPMSSSNAASSSRATEETFEYPDSESYQIYLDSLKLLEAYSLTYKDFVQADGMKKFKFECQKSLNITINAISHTSREQLVDKYNKLKLFLSGESNPNILLNPQAEAYSKNLLAQKIVDQGDITISSKPELAFSFAAIVIALWNDWPDFGALLLARFRTVSPFFAPVFFMPRVDQSEMDFYKSLGCKYNEDGTPEKPEQFWKRLAGIMYLYSSILITRQRLGVDKPHPHGIGNAWRWLAATLNIEPRCDIADICATLIFVMLEVAGNDLWRTYPNQFPKMLHVLNNVYLVKLKSFDAIVSAPISRLSDFLTTAMQTGSIPAPKGQLPPNFW